MIHLNSNYINGREEAHIKNLQYHSLTVTLSICYLACDISKFEVSISPKRVTTHTVSESVLQHDTEEMAEYKSQTVSGSLNVTALRNQ